MTPEEIANAKLQTFMNLHHEVQTPLTLIVSSLQSLIKEDKDPQRQNSYEIMRRNVERLLRLSNQILDIDRLEKGEMKMQMCETDLIGFLDNICQLFAHEVKAKMIVFNFLHDMHLLPVWIDRVNFDKAIVNLLHNSFKYTPVGGSITLRVAQQEGKVVITIHDTGIGIPGMGLDKVFERYYQANLTAENLNTGTGIGLDLTNRIIGLHHGTIDVHNNTDGPGCEFRIVLPLGCEHLSIDELQLEKTTVAHLNRMIEEEAIDMPTTVDLKQQNRQRIVVVEDDKDVRDFLVSELSGDFDVTACTNGREGLAAVGTTLPDLVVSDVRMPVMDGFALCSRIKNNSATSHIPVIMLTTQNANADRLEGLEANADAYLPKPFNMDVLRQIINNLLRRYRMLKLKYGRNDQLEELVDDVKIKSPDDQLLERIMMVINKNIDNTELGVDEIADTVGISRVHLHRKMKELTGQTPSDFIRGIRLRKAAQLLAKGGMSISQVVYACGFGSAANFSTLFKKVYGVTPSEYMKSKE